MYSYYNTCLFLRHMSKKVDKKKKKTKDEMSFLDHLEVLRWHLFRSVAAVVILGITFFSLGKSVFENIIFAPLNKDFISYRFFCWVSNATCLRDPNLQLIRKELGEEFFVHIKVSIFLGIAAAMPYIIWEVWKFIKPGLYDNEKKYARGFVAICSTLFMLGISFGYFIIAPFAISFLSNYAVSVDTVEATSTLSSYISYLSMFTFPSGLLFQLPVVVYFLTKIGIITPTFMRQYRRHAYVVLLVLAAVITPPDAISQVLICIPLYSLYELSIIVSKRVYKNLQKEDDE